MIRSGTVKWVIYRKSNDDNAVDANNATDDDNNNNNNNNLRKPQGRETD